MAIDPTINAARAVSSTTVTTSVTIKTGTTGVPATTAANSPQVSTPGGTVAEPRAYLRQMKAVHDAVAAMAEKLTFKSPQAARAYQAKTEQGLLAALHQGKRGDLTTLLQDLPNEALAAASKSLAASEARDAKADRLLQTLGDYLAAAKTRNAAPGRTRFSV
jgi:hypothetical protein